MLLTTSSRRKTNDDRVVMLRTLTEASVNMICPIKLLLVQAFRSGNVFASSLGELLETTWRRVDKTVQWRYPDRPVLPSMSQDNPAFLIWDKPAPALQLLLTTKEIGMVAGVLEELRSHDWRRGAARDLAYLPGPIQGAGNPAVAKALGHSRHTLGRGITDDYIGFIEEDLYEKRVANGFKGRRDPLLGEPFKKVKLAPDEITKYCVENGWETQDKVARKRAGNRINRLKKQRWITEEKERHLAPQALPITQPPPQERTFNRINPRPAQGPGKIETSNSNPQDTADNDMSLIDPQLRNATDEEVYYLQSVLAGESIGTEDEAIGDSQAARSKEMLGMSVLLDNVQSEMPEQLCLPPGQFVEFFARINIVQNGSLQKTCHNLEVLFPAKVPMGNTRDYPSLFVFRCDIEGCTYTTTQKVVFDKHVKICTPTKNIKQPTAFECQDCNVYFKSDKTSKKHLSYVHKWEPKRCLKPGCTVQTVFENGYAYHNHLAAAHKEIAATRCLVQGCTSDKVFTSLQTYQYHLRGHGLNTMAKQKNYLPGNTAAAD